MTGTCVVEWEMDINLKTTTAHHTCICYHQLLCPGSNNTSAWSTYLGSPPSGRITPSYAYGTLSLSRGRDIIRLLHDFDERLFTRHPNEHFREEVIWLQRLDHATKMKWDAFQIRQGVRWNGRVDRKVVVFKASTLFRTGTTTQIVVSSK